MSDKRTIRRELVKQMRKSLPEHPVDPQDRRSIAVRKHVRRILGRLQEGDAVTRDLWIHMIEDPNWIDSYINMWAEGSGSAGAVLTTLQALEVTEGEFGGRVRSELR